MKREQLTKTIALTLALMSVTQITPVFPKSVTDGLGIIREAYANTTMIPVGKDVDSSLYAKESTYKTTKQFSNGKIYGITYDYNTATLSEIDPSTGEGTEVASDSETKDWNGGVQETNSDKLYRLGKDRYITVGSDYTFSMDTYIRCSGYATIIDSSSVKTLKFSTKGYSTKNNLIALTGAGRAKDGNIVLASICSQTNQFRPTGGNGSSYESVITVVDNDGKIISTINLKHSRLIRDIVQLDDGTFLAYYPDYESSSYFPEGTSIDHVSHIDATGKELNKVNVSADRGFMFLDDNRFVAVDGRSIVIYNSDLTIYKELEDISQKVDYREGLGDLEYSELNDSFLLKTDKSALSIDKDLTNVEVTMKSGDGINPKFEKLQYYPSDKLVFYKTSASAVPYGYTNKNILANINGNNEILNTYRSFDIYFKYRRENGSITQSYKSYYKATQPDPSYITIPEDRYNYMTFGKWDDDLTTYYTKYKTINATYKESSDSFWIGNNRYGIKSESDKTVVFLGSKDETVVVPPTISYNGNEYSVTLQKNCANREGTIKNITVNGSSIVGESIFANSSLETVKIIGDVKLPDSTFYSNEKLKYIDCKDVVKFNRSAIVGCSALEVIRGYESDIRSNSILDNKVYLYNSDMSKTLGSYWVKDGINFLPYANMIGKNWKKESGSVIVNITEDSIFTGDEGTSENQKLEAPILNISKQNPNNREDVTASIS